MSINTLIAKNNAYYALFEMFDIPFGTQGLTDSCHCVRIGYWHLNDALEAK
jgi:hypothetical protein